MFFILGVNDFYIHVSLWATESAPPDQSISISSSDNCWFESNVQTPSKSPAHSYRPPEIHID